MAKAATWAWSSDAAHDRDTMRLCATEAASAFAARRACTSCVMVGGRRDDVHGHVVTAHFEPSHPLLVSFAAVEPW